MTKKNTLACTIAAKRREGAGGMFGVRKVYRGLARAKFLVP